MPEQSYEAIKSLLRSSQAGELRRGLQLVRQEIARVGSREARALFEMVAALFYIDPLDRPDLVPILDEAVSLVVGFGEWVIPVLLEDLEYGDLKSQIAIGHALGRVGADAIRPLLAEYAASADSGRRTFILYALGKIKSPQIAAALPLALEAAGSPDRELRDTATRALGKFAESIPPVQLSAEHRQAILERLQANLADASPGIRAKAVRSWGKLAKFGHLDPAQHERLRAVCRRLLGKDEQFEWDRAYVVRREAEEALLVA
ncbi:MAG TPA: HEAT repeat domain-containing protein [Candidatus Saccharimonadales bacterium]|nr:HEAT repeat domain-containing protein [Candidatus Saccharimonadales bacterium]